MVTELGFNQLELTDVVELASGSTLIYAHFPEHYFLYRFRVSRDGKVWGYSYEHWLELNPDSASEIKKLLNGHSNKVPVYLSGFKEDIAS